MTTRSMARTWNANKENIPVYKPTPENDPCPICFTDFQTLNKSTTNCGHTFCTSCLLKWFIKSNSCPCCRAQLVKKSIIIPTNADMIEALNDALHEFLTDRGVTMEQVIANPIEIHSHELQKFNRYITSIVLTTYYDYLLINQDVLSCPIVNASILQTSWFINLVETGVINIISVATIVLEPPALAPLALTPAPLAQSIII